jgi:hypothetical protein
MSSNSIQSLRTYLEAGSCKVLSVARCAGSYLRQSATETKLDILRVVLEVSIPKGYEGFPNGLKQRFVEYIGPKHPFHGMNPITLVMMDEKQVEFSPNTTRELSVPVKVSFPATIDIMTYDPKKGVGKRTIPYKAEMIVHTKDGPKVKAVVDTILDISAFKPVEEKPMGCLTMSSSSENPMNQMFIDKAKRFCGIDDTLDELPMQMVSSKELAAAEVKGSKEEIVSTTTATTTTTTTTQALTPTTSTPAVTTITTTPTTTTTTTTTTPSPIAPDTVPTPLAAYPVLPPPPPPAIPIPSAPVEPVLPSVSPGSAASKHGQPAAIAESTGPGTGTVEKAVGATGSCSIVASQLPGSENDSEVDVGSEEEELSAALRAAPPTSSETAKKDLMLEIPSITTEERVKTPVAEAWGYLKEASFRFIWGRPVEPSTPDVEAIVQASSSTVAMSSAVTSTTEPTTTVTTATSTLTSSSTTTTTTTTSSVV